MQKSLLGDNLAAFNEVLKKTFNSTFAFSSFKDALDYVFEYAETHKTLLIIDEFPFLWDVYPLIVSFVRDLIDEYKRKSSMKFILSGSAVTAMKSLNDGHNETYCRFTGIISLKAFDYYDSSFFYPDYSEEDKILMYSVFGGAAFFNSPIDPKQSALDNIERLLLSPNSILQLEVENTIAGEMNKIASVNSVFELFDKGVNKYTDIVNQLTAKQGKKASPDYVLKKLIELEIMEKVSPLTTKKTKRRSSTVFPTI